MFTAALAIVPLWSGAFSLWALAFPEPARVRMTIAACKPGQVLVYLSNTGGTPAMLGQPSIEFQSDRQWARFEMEFAMDEDDLLSEPDEIDIVNLTPPEGASFSTQTDGGCALRATFPVTSADEERKTVGESCRCQG